MSSSRHSDLSVGYVFYILYSGGGLVNMRQLVLRLPVAFQCESLSECTILLVLYLLPSPRQVSFHPCEAHLLISGSHDGFMKLFDLRRREATQTFTRSAEHLMCRLFSAFFFFFLAYEGQENKSRYFEGCGKPRFKGQSAGCFVFDSFEEITHEHPDKTAHLYQKDYLQVQTWL